MFKVFKVNQDVPMIPLTVYGTRHTGSQLYFLFYNRDDGWYWENAGNFRPAITS